MSCLKLIWDNSHLKIFSEQPAPHLILHIMLYINGLNDSQLTPLLYLMNWRGKFKPFKTNTTGGCMVYHTKNIKQTSMYGNRSVSLPDVRSFQCQRSKVTMVQPCLPSWYAEEKSYHKGQWMVVVAEEECVNHGRKTLRPIDVDIAAHRRW